MVRRGWGVEAYTHDLQPLAEVELPGEARDITGRSGGEAVTLGSFGVAVISELALDPVVSFLKSNVDPPGKARTFVRVDGTYLSGLLTPEGFSWTDVLGTFELVKEDEVSAGVEDELSLGPVRSEAAPEPAPENLDCTSRN